MVSIRRIRTGQCEIWGRCNEDGDGGLFQELRDLPEVYAASKAGLVELFNRVGQSGLSGLTDALSHRVDDKEGIWEFIKGDLRLFYFKDGGSVIVCTECRVKKAQKVDPAAVRAAASFKKKYLAAKAAGTLTKLEGKKK